MVDTEKRVENNKNMADTDTLLRLGSIPARRYSNKGFSIGLPVVLFFCVVCWMGARYAFTQITMEQTVNRHGATVTGIVSKKIFQTNSEYWEQKHYITYVFQTPDGKKFHKKIGVKPEFWRSLKENGPITIRYIPKEPNLNLPDTWHMTRSYFLAGGMSLLGAFLFTVVLLGMLIKKIKNGYEG